MKKISFTLLLSFFSLLVFSQARIPVNDPPPGNKPTTNPAPTTTGTSTTSSELVKYSDPQGRFTIGYPTAWKFDDKADNAVIQITSPKESDADDFRQNVNLQIENLNSSGLSLEQYVKTNMDGVKEAIKEYKEVSSMYFNRNGNRAYEIVYKGKYGSMAYQIQIKQLFTIVNSKAYILTYVSKVDERDAFETTANKIFNSLKY